MRGVQIRVFCRLRPAVGSAAECAADGASLALAAEDGRRHSFTFDKVFAPGAPQAAVFSEVAELVQSALDGYQVPPPPFPPPAATSICLLCHFCIRGHDALWDSQLPSLLLG